MAEEESLVTTCTDEDHERRKKRYQFCIDCGQPLQDQGGLRLKDKFYPCPGCGRFVHISWKWCGWCRQQLYDPNKGEAKLCCGVKPQVVGGGYPGSIALECPKCGKSSTAVYDTQGLNLELAIETWNKEYDAKENQERDPAGV